ncbi:hypothetical protein ACVW00_001594 [Marmoricola sp. URHA0025 HA25]
MRSKVRLFVLGVVAAMAATAAAPLPASGAGGTYAYFGATGGTQIEAVGTTISSSMTAMSQVGGLGSPGSTTNKVASVNAGTLASVGAVDTSEVATAHNDGWNLTGHARTADVSLLNGLIKIQAVDTTTTAQFDSTDGTVGSSNTRFLGLTIAGQTYPVDIARNTTISVPGIATIVLNYQNIGTNDNGIAAQGAGLVVTLLKSEATAAIGSTIILNPSYALVQKAGAPGGRSLTGFAYGSYVFAHVGDQVKAESGYTAFEVLPLSGTNGATLENHTAAVNLPGVLYASAIASTAEGVSSPALNESKMSTRTANVDLFPNLLFGSLIHADAIGSNASVVQENGTTKMTGGMQFLNLRVGNTAIPVNVGPNTSIHIANLGTVTVNEQTEYDIPGFVHLKQVIALHIVLDTATAGLPIGAEIQIGVSQATVWGG